MRRFVRAALLCWFVAIPAFAQTPDAIWSSLIEGNRAFVAGTVTELHEDGRVTGFRIDPGDGGAPFELENRDFNFRSLRGNAVLRWEWRPGSTLFFVWQQQRTDFADYDGFGITEELGEVFRAPVENVFLVKATYWLGL